MPISLKVTYRELIPVKEVKYVSVAKAARYLHVSRQRVCVLLKCGRLAGRLYSLGEGRRYTWQVEWPPVVRGGLRGPRMGQKPPLSKAVNTSNSAEKEARKIVPHGLTEV